MTYSDLAFFVDLIHLNGRKPEYLKIFETLNQMVNVSNPETFEMKKKMLEVLLDENKRDGINPFVERDLEMSRQYSFDYDEDTLNEYKIKFVVIIAKAFESEVALNLISRAQKWFPIKELLTILLELGGERRQNIYNNSTKLVNLLLLFLNKSETYFNDFVEDYKLFPEILEIESQQMKLDEEAFQFLKDGFIQLLVSYAQGVFDNTE